jgi:hypothetical protein
VRRGSKDTGRGVEASKEITKNTNEIIMKKENIEQARQGALDDCWKYHKDILKEHTTKKELWNYLQDAELTDWEDVGFFIGYIRALDYIPNLKTK